MYRKSNFHIIFVHEKQDTQGNLQPAARKAHSKQIQEFERLSGSPLYVLLGQNYKTILYYLRSTKKSSRLGEKSNPIFFFGADSSLCLLPQHFYDQLGLICFLSKNCAIVFQRVQYLSQKMLYKIHSCRQLDKQFKLFWFKSFQLLNTEIGIRVLL